jgi:MOSC domain-containing protein YiiM
MARIVSIVYTPTGVERKPTNNYARVPLERAMLMAKHGIEGDVKGTSGSRQLNIMRAETLQDLAAEGLHTKPGQLGEQIVIEGVERNLFVEGTRFQIGDAIIEVGIPRTGCDRFEHIQSTSKKSVQGRLGVLARVITGGEIAVGDAVTPVSA